MEAALKEAIQRIGGYGATGRALGIAWQSVQRWPIAPVRRVLALEKFSGVSRHRLRPDIYPVDKAAE
jgi:DNA-binding transcriptional regulator YdaS (Cro superfamily)